MKQRLLIAWCVLLPWLAQSAATNQAQTALVKQLETWVVPDLQLRQASLAEAAETIHAAAKGTAPAGQSLNLRVHPDAAGAARITMSLRKVPMAKLLDYVTNVAGADWMLEDGEVVIVPRDHPGARSRHNAGFEPLSPSAPAITNLLAFHFEVYQVSERDATELGKLLPAPDPATSATKAEDCQAILKRFAMMSGKRLLCALDKTSRSGVCEQPEQKKLGSTTVEIICTPTLGRDGQCALQVQSSVQAANQAATAPGSCLFNQPGAQALLLHIPAPVAGRGTTKYFVTLIKYVGLKPQK